MYEPDPKFVFFSAMYLPKCFCQIILHSTGGLAWTIWPVLIIDLISSVTLLVIISVGSMFHTGMHGFEAAFVPLIWPCRNRPGIVAGMLCCVSSLREGQKRKLPLRMAVSLGKPSCRLPSPAVLCLREGAHSSPTLCVCRPLCLLNSQDKNEVFTVTLIRLWSVNKY